MDTQVNSKKVNRLPASYPLRLTECGITRQAIADASPRFHPKGHEITSQFVTRCVTARDACPPWLRIQIDAMLHEAECPEPSASSIPGLPGEATGEGEGRPFSNLSVLPGEATGEGERGQ